MALGQILSQSISRNEHFVAPVRRAPAANAPTSLSKNINRLISAAVVSARFQRQLLTDPVAALAAGYNGEKFQLTPVEYAAVTSLRVSTVRDFAAQLLRALQYANDATLFPQEAQVDYRFAEVTRQQVTRQ